MGKSAAVSWIAISCDRYWPRADPEIRDLGHVVLSGDPGEEGVHFDDPCDYGFVEVQIIGRGPVKTTWIDRANWLQ